MSDPKETNEELSQDELKDISGGFLATQDVNAFPIGDLGKKPAGRKNQLSQGALRLKAPSQEGSSDFHDAECLDP